MTILNGTTASSSRPSTPAAVLAGQATYWDVGIDIGSDFSIAFATPVFVANEGGRDTEYRGATTYLKLPSIIGDIAFDELVVARGWLEGTPYSKVLKEDEFVVKTTFKKTERVVGWWAELEGKNWSAAKGLAERYWGTHAREIMLALLGAMIPTQEATIRLVTGLPFSLYSQPGSRERVKENLEGVHHFSLNGVYKQFAVLVGTVIMEGYAALVYQPEIDGEQVSIDFGGRTVNFIYTHGTTIIHNRCFCEEMGIGQIHESIIKRMRRKYTSAMKLSECRDLLTRYTAGAVLPAIETPNKRLEDSDLRKLIEDEITTHWTAIETRIGQALNAEGADIASTIKRATLSGGGAFIYQHKVRAYLAHTLVVVPEDAQDQNARYYHDLVKQLERSKPDIWIR